MRRDGWARRYRRHPVNSMRSGLRSAARSRLLVRVPGMYHIDVSDGRLLAAAHRRAWDQRSVPLGVRLPCVPNAAGRLRSARAGKRRDSSSRRAPTIGACCPRDARRPAGVGQRLVLSPAGRSRPRSTLAPPSDEQALLAGAQHQVATVDELGHSGRAVGDPFAVDRQAALARSAGAPPPFDVVQAARDGQSQGVGRVAVANS